ncbi:cysteine-rich CWC family protein [Bradyrhizobium sp. C-145]|uniref:cysteine-rich CWC family protein n=1 Tax=Bradyrhizobium sp. C-145 TaxID=574727 RepID=UPI00201B5B79|nr:cysteine-rich CWC family protein [Bradyrhizobium sp. C-145]UQR64783.1 cysteine-rich CWC family protein [Bradyrhizobium sp. C-145]
MTNPQESSLQEPRRLTCSRCGTEFGCDLSGNCWCAEETAKLPIPIEGEDCLCRECLRKAAAEARSPDGMQA